MVHFFKFRFQEKDLMRKKIKATLTFHTGRVYGPYVIVVVNYWRKKSLFDRNGNDERICFCFTSAR